MVNMLEELLRENDMIQGNHNHFKKLHKRIARYDLDEALACISRSKVQPIENRQAESKKIIAFVKDAESLIEEYEEFQENNFHMSHADTKVDKIGEMVDQYREQLPRLVKENYSKFCSYHKKLRRAKKPDEQKALRELTIRYAGEFRNYFDEAKDYQINVFTFEESKIRKAREYLRDFEEDEAVVKGIKTNEPEKPKKPAKARTGPKKEVSKYERFLKIEVDKDNFYDLYVKPEDPETVKKGSVDGSDYFGLSYNLKKLGDNKRYQALRDTINLKERIEIDTLAKLSAKIEEMTDSEKFARDKNDLEYFESLYCCVREPLRRGALLRFRTAENEPIIKDLLENFENHIAKSKKSLIIQGSLQYSKAS